MPQITRTIEDVPQDQVATQQAILEADGFTVQVQQQGDGLFTLTGTKDDGAC